MDNSDFFPSITTRSGFRFQVRKACPSDEDSIREFFTHVSRADLRFRFLATINEILPDQISMLTHPDHALSESFVAFTEDGSTMIASGMLACDAAFDRGEVAIAIREDHKQRGIGWELLSHIAQFAEAKGLKTLQSIESRDNHQAIELERDMGFVASAYPGDPSLVLVSRSLGQN